MTLAPQITNLPLTVARDGAGTASFTIDFTPALRAGPAGIAGARPAEAAAPPLQSRQQRRSTFVIPHAPVGEHLARLRIDGIDSPIIDLRRRRRRSSISGSRSMT